MPNIPHDPELPPLMSVTEAAAELGVTRQAILKMAANGQLLGRKAGNTWVFRSVTVRAAKRARG
jgi:excisionase family DNA binding protein